MPHIYHSQRLRKARSSVIGTVYHLRFSTQDKREYLADFATARAVVHAIAQEHNSGRASCLCYCVMPDHVHWLMRLRKGTIGRSVHNVKRLSIHLSKQRIDWQSDFFDHGITDESVLRKTARYIVANPVRANLVSAVGDYPHWDAMWLDGESDDVF